MYSSSVEESVRLKENHMKDINSTVVRLPSFVLDSKTVAETDVVAESVEDMFPSFKCMVFCNGPGRDGDHGDAHSVARNGVQEVHLRDQTCER